MHWIIASPLHNYLTLKVISAPSESLTITLIFWLLSSAADMVDFDATGSEIRRNERWRRLKWRDGLKIWFFNAESLEALQGGSNG